MSIKIYDKNGNEIKDGEKFMYKAISTKPPIEAKIVTRNGERYITWIDGVEHLLEDFWRQWDSELSEKVQS